MKKDLLRRSAAVLLTLACIAPAAAQRYTVDLLFSTDSAQVYTIERSQNYDAELPGVLAFKIPNGEEVTLTRTLEGNSGIGAFTRAGKTYCISSSDLVISDENPEGTPDLFPNHRQRYSAAQHFYTTATPYWMIAALFIAAIALALLGRAARFRKAALIGMPLCILLASLLEIGGYSLIGSTVFWWCDYDRYGFFGSLVRALPYLGFVAFQLYSIKLYEKMLFTEDSDKKISIKPMAVSIGACIPLTAVAVIAGVTWWRPAAEAVAVLVFLLSLGTGTFLSYRKNVRTAGAFNGTMLTVFTAFYLLGLIIASWGLIVLLLRLLFQILILLGCIGAVLFLGASAAGPGGGNGSRTVAAWQNAEGRWENGNGKSYSSMHEATHPH